MKPPGNATIEVDAVRRTVESLERIAGYVAGASDDGKTLVRHGLEAHAAGIQTAIRVIRADLLGENPWAEEDETEAVAS